LVLKIFLRESLGGELGLGWELIGSREEEDEREGRVFGIGAENHLQGGINFNENCEIPYIYWVVAMSIMVDWGWCCSSLRIGVCLWVLQSVQR
jgi:hypothetical protein